MKKLFCIVFILFMMVNTLVSQSIKTYYVKRTTSTIVIDGKLTEQDWADAIATDSFRLVDSGKSGKVATIVKALWNDEYLYIAFIAQDLSLWADIIHKDQPLWKRDVVELFIDTNGDSTNYTEIGVGANGSYYDYVLPEKPERRKVKINTGWDLPDFDPKVSYTGSLNDTVLDVGWIAEIAIPFNRVPAPASLHVPHEGEVWRVNFCRIDFSYNNLSSAYYYAWNPTGAIAFHRPSKFGRLVFDKK